MDVAAILQGFYKNQRHKMSSNMVSGSKKEDFSQRLLRGFTTKFVDGQMNRINFSSEVGDTEVEGYLKRVEREMQ